jgi:hypothetical protein
LTASPAAGRRRIQRLLKYRPEQLGKTGGPLYGAIRSRLEKYGQTRSVYDQHEELVATQKLIGDWLTKHKKDSSDEAEKHRTRLNDLDKEITEELKTLAPQAGYVKDMLLQNLLYTSSDAYTERAAVRDLIEGKADPSKAEQGRDEKALRRLEKFPLTEAELLAIRVYTVGDYAIINPTVEKSAAGDERLQENLPKLGGQPTVDLWTALRLRGPKPPDTDPKALKAWEDKEKAYKAAAAAHLAQTHLNVVKSEAERHAAMLVSALKKLEPEKRDTFRGMRIKWSDYLEKWEGKEGTFADWNAFVSTSKEPSVAIDYAEQKEDTDKRIGIVFTCKLKTARDIAKLSVHRKEKEMMLLPGAALLIESVKPAGSSRYDYDVTLREL